MIAALYVDPRGPYPSMSNVDAWDATRDATTYAGPWPIVAHPACGPWGRLRHLYRGSEGGPELALIAIDQVRKWGGVFEHPKGSKVFGDASQPYTLPPPDAPADAWGGYTVRVHQCEWGHVARKTTWLYLVGVPREALEAPPYPGRAPTHWVSGGRKIRRADCRGGSGGVVPAGIKACSAEQRRRTPPAFAAYLVRLAHAVRR